MTTALSIYVLGLHASLGVPVVVREFVLSKQSLEAIRRARAAAQRRSPKRKESWSAEGRAVLLDGETYGLLAAALRDQGAKIVDHAEVVFPLPVRQGWALREEASKGGHVPSVRDAGLRFVDPIASKLDMQSLGGGRAGMRDFERGQAAGAGEQGDPIVIKTGGFIKGEWDWDSFSLGLKGKVNGFPIFIPDAPTATTPQTWPTTPPDSSSNGLGPHFIDPIDVIWFDQAVDGAVDWFVDTAKTVWSGLKAGFGGVVADDDSSSGDGTPPPADPAPADDGEPPDGESPTPNEDEDPDPEPAQDDAEDSGGDSDDEPDEDGSEDDEGTTQDSTPGDPQGDRSEAPTGDAAAAFLEKLQGFLPVVADPDPRSDGEGAYLAFISDEVVAQLIGPWGSLDPWILRDPTRESRSGAMIEVETFTVNDLVTDPPKDTAGIVSTFAQKLSTTSAGVAMAPRPGAAFVVQGAVVAHRLGVIDLAAGRDRGASSRA